MGFRSADTSWEILRRQIIRETEAALEYGLDHPEETVRIPTVIVGTARFHPRFAESFWHHVLNLDETRSVSFLRRLTSVFLPAGRP